jgi:hypothetical protein
MVMPLPDECRSAAQQKAARALHRTASDSTADHAVPPIITNQ